MRNNTRICRECGSPFEQVLRGRPRKRCYSCSPAILNQPGTEAHRLGFAVVITNNPGGQKNESVGLNPASHGRAALQDRGIAVPCPWCGGAAKPSLILDCAPFCSPEHRRFFAERVARKAQGQHMNDRKGRLKPDRTYRKDRKVAA